MNAETFAKMYVGHKVMFIDKCSDFVGEGVIVGYVKDDKIDKERDILIVTLLNSQKGWNMNILGKTDIVIGREHLENNLFYVAMSSVYKIDGRIM